MWQNSGDGGGGGGGGWGVGGVAEYITSVFRDASSSVSLITDSLYTRPTVKSTDNLMTPLIQYQLFFCCGYFFGYWNIVFLVAAVFYTTMPQEWSKIYAVFQKPHWVADFFSNRLTPQ